MLELVQSSATATCASPGILVCCRHLGFVLDCAPHQPCWIGPRTSHVSSSTVPIDISRTLRSTVFASTSLQYDRAALDSCSHSRSHGGDGRRLAVGPQATSSESMSGTFIPRLRLSHTISPILNIVIACRETLKLNALTPPSQIPVTMRIRGIPVIGSTRLCEECGVHRYRCCTSACVRLARRDRNPDTRVSSEDATTPSRCSDFYDAVSTGVSELFLFTRGCDASPRSLDALEYGTVLGGFDEVLSGCLRAHA